MEAVNDVCEFDLGGGRVDDGGKEVAVGNQTTRREKRKQTRRPSQRERARDRRGGDSPDAEINSLLPEIVLKNDEPAVGKRGGDGCQIEKLAREKERGGGDQRVEIGNIVQDFVESGDG